VLIYLRNWVGMGLVIKKKVGKISKYIEIFKDKF
jgi:hypothetical protein